MKILRYADPAGRVGHARETAAGIEALDGSMAEGFHPSGEPARIARILAPLEPAAILCIGLNYRRHAEETGAKLPQYPVLFMKNPAAVIGPGEPIVLPGALPSRQVDYECELAVVIGRRCRRVGRAEAGDYVLGYTCANDVSARDWQKHGGGRQWCLGKSFDTFCPLGPCIATPDEIPDPNALRLRTKVDGVTVQDSTTADMIFPVAVLIEFLSAAMTLLPGTVILTGTPSGVGMAAEPPRWLEPGSSVSVVIESIGTLDNPVEAEAGCVPIAEPPETHHHGL